MLRVALALLFGTVTLALAQSQPQPQAMTEAATQLSARISSLLPRPATVSLEFQNLTALAPAELSSFRTALEEELRKTGLEIAPAAQPETRVRVTISENIRGLLFVAAATSGDKRQIAMLPWTAPPAAPFKPRVRITMQPLREQAEIVLDTLLLDSGAQLLVLSANRVSSYRLINGKWTPAGIVGISLARPLPRDARGRIENGPAGLHVYAPGTICSGTLQPEFKFTCAPGNEPWQVNPRDASFAVRWVTDRNVMESDDAKGQFYTQAIGWRSTPDGRVQDRAGETLAGADTWGSELASIENPCGSGWMVLAAKAGANEERDQIQSYEIQEGRTVAVSEPITLEGPVTALWPAETPGQATLVIRSSKTGHYEASRLGVACAE